jgi:hypothetical protein
MGTVRCRYTCKHPDTIKRCILSGMRRLCSSLLHLITFICNPCSSANMFSCASVAKHPRREGVWGGGGRIDPRSVDLGTGWRQVVQLHAPAALPRGKNPRTHWIGVWVAPEPVWTIWTRQQFFDLTGTRSLTPSRAARNQSGTTADPSCGDVCVTLLLLLSKEENRPVL